MWEFVIKYWIDFLFGAIVAGAGVFFKKFWKLSKQEHEQEQKEFYNDIKKEISDSYKQSQEDDEALEGEITELKESLDCLRDGVLSIQGKQFRQECRALLAEDHEITLDEYQDIDEEHRIYNALGGNHKGDSLFALVKKKAENILTD